MNAAASSSRAMNNRLREPELPPPCSNSGKAQPPIAAAHWQDIARQWDRVGPPLRPSPQDVAFCVDAVRRRSGDNGPPRVLILGVTPELYSLPWPGGTDVLAVDYTPSMIEAVWPGPREAAICEDWTAMRLAAGSRDLVLCDGGIHLLAYPEGHRALVRKLRHVVAPGGLCVFRLFIPPPQRESHEAVLQDLLSGKIANVNVLKLRLAMALQEDAVRGVELHRVWEAVHQVAPDFDRLAGRLDWPIEHLLAFNTYRDCRIRYCFLSVAEVSHLFCGDPGVFRLDAVTAPTYELGERCPTVVLRRGGPDAMERDRPQ